MIQLKKLWYQVMDDGFFVDTTIVQWLLKHHRCTKYHNTVQSASSSLCQLKKYSDSRILYHNTVQSASSSLCQLKKYSDSRYHNTVQSPSSSLCQLKKYSDSRTLFKSNVPGMKWTCVKKTLKFFSNRYCDSEKNM